uniref:Photosystem I reaction center subunit VIII n=1 Tax=Saxegothaea conspicua TaxID=56905 RepID=A0A3Q9WY55_9CONI|nr:photosystem I subunit VIII [Saxegothaea conspicua]BBF91265.1 photosystem I subunit VIII [Saxegothaea conspicua]
MINMIPSIFVPLVGLFVPAVTMAFLYFYIQKDQIL